MNSSKIKIKVQGIWGRKKEYTVENLLENDTIASVKNELAKKLGESAANIRLYMTTSKQELDDDMQLSSYGIENDAILRYRIERDPGQIEVHVKNIVTKATVPVYDLHASDTISTLKHLLDDLQLVPAAKQILYFGSDQPLKNNKTLEFYHIENGAQLELGSLEDHLCPIINSQQ